MYWWIWQQYTQREAGEHCSLEFRVIFYSGIWILNNFLIWNEKRDLLSVSVNFSFPFPYKPNQIFQYQVALASFARENAYVKMCLHFQLVFILSCCFFHNWIDDEWYQRRLMSSIVNWLPCHAKEKGSIFKKNLFMEEGTIEIYEFCKFFNHFLRL